MTTLNATPTKEFLNQMFEFSLNHRMQLDFDQALDYIDAIESYNNFDACSVKAMLNAIDVIIPREYYNEGNPNNGNRAYKISIGRENSPVIYLDLIAFRQAVPAFQTGYADLVAKIHAAAKIAYCDEFSHEYDEYRVTERQGPLSASLEIRMWWD